MRYSPTELDVFVDEQGYDHGDQGVVPAGHEHDGDAEGQAQKRQHPAETRRRQKTQANAQLKLAAMCTKKDKTTAITLQRKKS